MKYLLILQLRGDRGQLSFNFATSKSNDLATVETNIHRKLAGEFKLSSILNASSKFRLELKT